MSAKDGGAPGRRAALERQAKFREERRSYVTRRLTPGERIRAEGRSPALVTDARIIIAWTLTVPPRRGEWAHDSLRFNEITAWRRGRTHDLRPIVELEHPMHMRIGHVPAHRFLWLEWGNAEAPLPHSSTRFHFSSDRDPLFAAVIAGLRTAKAPEGDPFHERPSGTRADRTAHSTGPLHRAP
jgi:hypothetical protein